MKQSKFTIQFQNLHWMSESPLTDLCAHGSVRIRLGDRIIEESDLCLTTAALFLMRSVHENSKANAASTFVSKQLIPHCGHSWIAAGSDVIVLSGCPIGIGWRVENLADRVVLSDFEWVSDTSGQSAISLDPIDVPSTDYARAILDAVDTVKIFHCSQPQRIFTDEDARDGYRAFWNEFARTEIMVRALTNP